MYLQSTISRYQKEGTTADRRRHGRLHLTAQARHLRNRFTTASSTTAAIEGLRRIFDQTAKNRLHEAGLRDRQTLTQQGVQYLASVVRTVSLSCIILSIKRHNINLTTNKQI